MILTLDTAVYVRVAGYEYTWCLVLVCNKAASRA